MRFGKPNVHFNAQWYDIDSFDKKLLQPFVSVISSSPCKDIQKDVNNLSLTESSNDAKILKKNLTELFKLLVALSNSDDSVKLLFKMHPKYLYSIKKSIFTTLILKTGIKQCLLFILKITTLVFVKFTVSLCCLGLLSNVNSERFSPETVWQKYNYVFIISLNVYLSYFWPPPI